MLSIRRTPTPSNTDHVSISSPIVLSPPPPLPLTAADKVLVIQGHPVGY